VGNDEKPTFLCWFFILFKETFICIEQILSVYSGLKKI
ncbi:hypothetical protein, partial [uncultured Gammaproteobacteria bacterium]